MREVDWYSEFENVQDCWNSFECKLITVIDEIAPVSKFVNNEIKVKPCAHVKNKLNIRKRLLRTCKLFPTKILKNRIKNINSEIRNHFKFLKRAKIQRSL